MESTYLPSVAFTQQAAVPPAFLAQEAAATPTAALPVRAVPLADRKAPRHAAAQLAKAVARWA